MGQRLFAIAVAGALVLVAVGCGGEEEKVFRPEALEDPGPVHVHGLGIDPKDGTLFIATHTGLWRLAPGEPKATRIADRYQDTMGFTVADAGYLLGSGHPDLKESREKGLPPLLGLIESRDGGETWQPVSLLGEADFHILRFAGDWVYGFDATNVRLLLSKDEGKAWSQQAPPGFPPEPLVDLAVDPRDAAHLLATTELALYESGDEGRSWEPIGPEVGLLAWLSEERLYLVTLEGRVLVSRDGGESWQEVGDVGGEPAALLAQSEKELYVAVSGGTIKASDDGGASWSVRFSP